MSCIDMLSNRIVRTLEEFTKYEDKNYWVLDLEAKGTRYFSGALILGFGIYFPSTSTACYIPVRQWNPETKSLDTEVATEKELLLYIERELPKRKLIMHNSMFDQGWLNYLGIPCKCWWDTRIAAHILEPELPGRYSLDDLIESKLGISSHKGVYETRIKGLGGKKGDIYLLPLSELAEYCCHDLVRTYELWQVQKPDIEDMGVFDFMSNFQLAFQDILVRQYWKGFKISRSKLIKYMDRLQLLDRLYKDKIIELAAEYIKIIEDKLFNSKVDSLKSDKAKDRYKSDSQLKSKYKFNFNSRQHVAWLFELLGVEIKERTEKDAVKTDKATLLKYSKENKVVEYFVRRNELQDKLKFVKQYLEVLDSDSIYHGEADLCGTASGRLTYFKPNLLAANRRDWHLMRCFHARPGYKFVKQDFSSIEPCIEAHFADDDELKDIIINKKDMYMELTKYIYPEKAHLYSHDDVAGSKQRLKKEREILKTVRLGLGYGMGIPSLSYRIGSTLEEAKRIYNAYWSARYKVKQLANNLSILLLEGTKDKSKTLKNLFLRPIIIKNFKDIVNRFIQSSAHDCLIAMNLIIDENLKTGGIDAYPVICDWHDEFIYEVKEEDIDKFIEVSNKSLKELNNMINLSIELRMDCQVISNLSELGK